MRLPTFGMTVPAMLPPSRQVALCVFLEALGYDRVWLPDHLAFPEHGPAPDPWSVIAAAAVKTRRLVFGTAVSDPHRLHPAVFAQRLATIDQLARGRVILGLGSGEAMNLEPFGIAWDRKVARLAESVQVMRSLLDSDDPVTHDGAFFHLRGARLAVRPYQKRKLPIYLAALGPKMQALAGRVADGWLPVVLPADHYASYFAPMGEAAREAGRDPAALDRVAIVPVAITDDPSFTPERIAEMARPYSLVLVWPPVLRRMGIPFDPPAHLADFDYVHVNPFDEASLARYRELQEWIPAAMIHPMITFGSVARVRRAIGDYLDAGATHIDFVVVSPHRPLTTIVKLATDVIPYFARRRAPLAAHAVGAALPLLERLRVLREATARKLAAPEQKT